MTPATTLARRYGRGRRTAVGGLLLTVALGCLAGCGDDSDDPAKGSGGSSQSTDPTEPPGSDTPSETETEAETTPLGTGAAPASGPEVSIDALTLHLPQGWETSTKEFAGLIASPKDPYQLDFLEVSTIDNSGRSTGLDGAVREYRTLTRNAARTKKVDEVEVDGVPMARMSGPDGLVAFVSNSTAWTVALEFDPGDRAPEAQEKITDSVLATVDFTE